MSLIEEIVNIIKKELMSSLVRDRIPENILDHFLSQYVKFSLKGKFLPVKNLQQWLLGECDLSNEEANALLETIKSKGMKEDFIVVMPDEKIPSDSDKRNDEILEDDLEFVEEEQEELSYFIDDEEDVTELKWKPESDDNLPMLKSKSKNIQDTDRKITKGHYKK